jgi:multidrug efflux pump subunit AcrA (membrane-fusion protein)
MKKTIVGILVSLVALTGFATQATQISSPVHRLEQCLVKPADEVLLPAEEAGVLVRLAVEQGAMPRQGEVIGQIDDRQVKQQMNAAKYGFDAANERAQSQVEVLYAEESAKVAKQEYERMRLANAQISNAVTAVEIERARLQWNTTRLQIEKATKDKAIAALDAAAKRAEYELASVGLERRTIKAPFDGVVVELFRRQNEWVNPGDPVLRFARLDIMRIEPVVKLADYDPHEIADCNVTVEMPLARGRTATFTGKVTYVSPELDLTGDRYRIRAEVQNRQTETGRWLLMPNSLVTMTIHIGTGNRVNVGQRPR